MLVHVFKHSAVYEEKIVSFFFALSIHNNFAHFITLIQVFHIFCTIPKFYIRQKHDPPKKRIDTLSS